MFSYNAISALGANLLQVTFDDGEIELDVELHRLRTLEETDLRGDEKSAYHGPDWERQAVRPARGVEVAVFGYCESQVSRLLVDLIEGELLKTRRRWRRVAVLSVHMQSLYHHYWSRIAGEEAGWVGNGVTQSSCHSRIALEDRRFIVLNRATTYGQLSFVEDVFLFSFRLGGGVRVRSTKGGYGRSVTSCSCTLLCPRVRRSLVKLLESFPVWPVPSN